MALDGKVNMSAMVQINKQIRDMRIRHTRIMKHRRLKREREYEDFDPEPFLQKQQSFLERWEAKPWTFF